MKVTRRKIRRIVIEEDRFGLWVIRLYFNKGKCTTLPGSWDTHHSACLAASGVAMIQDWVKQ
jgi:hypothetical protein